MQRRSFIGDLTKAGLVIAGVGPLSNVMASTNADHKESAEKISGDFLKDSSGFSWIGFEQAPLPYSYTALEPVIDAMTMEIHYTKHAAAYAGNLRDAVKAENVAQGTTVENILSTVSKYSAKMRNNCGGHYNHELFWHCMKASTDNNEPAGKLSDAIKANFGSFAEMKTKFTDAAKGRFGSGWAWLYLDNNKKLAIGSTPNQDNPLMDIADIKGFPLLGIDVWEHAYYLKYQNRRPEYIENWWKLVNWEFVSKRFEQQIG